MEELSKWLDGLRCEAEAKSALVDGLRREAAEQAARLREARAEVERQAGEIAAKDQEASSAREACEGLRARLAEKEQAFRHLSAAHDGLKASLVAALEESEVKRLDQDAAMRSSSEEISRLKRLLSEKEKRCPVRPKPAAEMEEMSRELDGLRCEAEASAAEWATTGMEHLSPPRKTPRRNQPSPNPPPPSSANPLPANQPPSPPPPPSVNPPPSPPPPPSVNQPPSPPPPPSVNPPPPPAANPPPRNTNDKAKSTTRHGKSQAKRKTLSTESVEEVSRESTYSDHASPSGFACGVGKGRSQDDSSPLSERYILPEKSTLPPEMLSTESVEEVSRESTYSDHASPSGFACGVGKGWSQDDSSPLSEHYILPEKCTLPPEMVTKVRQKMKDISTEYPFFVRTITKSCIEGQFPLVYFCSKFEKYLPRADGKLFLQIENNKQTCTKYNKNEGRPCNPYTVWKKFLEENKLELEVGDVCVFQPTDQNRNRQTLRVHVIQLRE